MVIVEKSYLWLSRSLVAIEMEKIEQHLIFLLALLFIPQFCCSVLVDTAEYWNYCGTPCFLPFSKASIVPTFRWFKVKTLMPIRKQLVSSHDCFFFHLHMDTTC